MRRLHGSALAAALLLIISASACSSAPAVVEPTAAPIAAAAPPTAAPPTTAPATAAPPAATAATAAPPTTAPAATGAPHCRTTAAHAHYSAYCNRRAACRHDARLPQRLHRLPQPPRRLPQPPRRPPRHRPLRHPPQQPAGDVVVYAADLQPGALTDELTFLDDPASPGGKMIGLPNTGDKLDAPPEDDPHITFQAQVQGGMPYRGWVHMKVGLPKGCLAGESILCAIFGRARQSQPAGLHAGHRAAT